MFNFNFIKEIDSKNISHTIITNVYRKDNNCLLTGYAKELDALINGKIQKILQNRIFSDDLEIITLYSPDNISSPSILLIVIDESEYKLNSINMLLNIGANILQVMKSIKDKNISLCLSCEDSEIATIVSGLLLRAWQFSKYKTKPEQSIDLQNIEILCNSISYMENEVQNIKNIVSGINLARDLGSEPPNVLYPETFAKQIQDLSALGLKIKIYDKAEMEKMHMGAILGVAQGSIHPPFVVSIEWSGNGDSKPIALVGKGVCFDAGGISLKPPKNMHEMRFDMTAAAAVVGAMKSIALNKLPVNVVGVVGLVENMPDANAQRPGDVVTSMSGKTIEVIDTDAEGRLVLADCLWFAQDKFAPSLMISLGTLTGNTISSLINEYAGLFTYDDELANKIIKAGNASYDKVWRLPMGKPFTKNLESYLADMRNCHPTDSYGDNALAAEFLKRFTNDITFAHLDMAGVAWDEAGSTILAKGPTGYGVRLLHEFVKNNI